MYEYMRDDIKDDYNILLLQNKILEIMVEIDRLCQKHNIEYCLMGGSALGAKRHGGFIPWDDDLDIFMTPDNYEKFRDIFRNYGNQDKYYLQELCHTDGMITTSKVRMNGTTYIEESLRNLKMHHGIYIDIFILHTCPNNRILQMWQFFWGKYVITKGLTIRNQSRHSGFKGFLIAVAKLFPDRFLVRYALKQVYRFRGKDTNYYCNFLGKAVFHNAIYKKEYFDETEYVPFEKVELKAPKRLHEFLLNRFGDYMKVPNTEQIQWEQHVELWDVNKDFREYLCEIDSFSDERKLF